PFIKRPLIRLASLAVISLARSCRGWLHATSRALGTAGEQAAMWPNPRIPYQMSSKRARLKPLNGKPLMVNPVVAIEYWPFDRPMPRGILPAPHGRGSEPPDVANYSWVEYGMRCGLPRIFDVLGRRGIKASAWMNAQCADVYPAAAEHAASAGWDF